MKTLVLLTLLLSFPLYAQGISVITLEDISDQRFEKMGKVIETEKGNLMILEESDNDQKNV